MLKRVLIIFGILIAYRLLAQIPVPMGDASTFKEAVTNLLEKSDFSNFLNLISGGGLASFSIILVGMSPYITGSIVMQFILMRQKSTKVWIFGLTIVLILLVEQN